MVAQAIPLSDRAPSHRRNVVILVPAYNEERFIGSVVLKTLRYADAVVVVDDGSTDGTADIAEAAGAIVVRHERNQGKGTALNTGFRKARELGAVVTVTIDADGQHVPEEVTEVIGPILEDRADIVVGSRYIQPRSAVPQHRILGHRVFNFITGQASGVSLTDSQSGFRAFSSRALWALSFRSKGFSVESEMQFMAREHNLRTTEVPITVLYPDKPKRPVVAHGLSVLNGILRLAGQYRPLVYFGVPGLLLLLAGLGWGLWVVEIYRESRTLAMGYALVSTLLTSLGTLSVFSGLILHSVRGLLISLVRASDDT